LVANASQTDSDGDGKGDACDAPSTRLTLANPGPQTSTEGDHVSLQMVSNVFDLTSKPKKGKTVVFSAMNLPKNLQINENTGLIKGPIGEHSAGDYMVTVKVRYDGEEATVTFLWTVK